MRALRRSGGSGRNSGILAARALRRQRRNRACAQRLASTRLSSSTPPAPVEAISPPAVRAGWRTAAGRLFDMLLLVWCVLAAGVLVLRHVVLPAVGDFRAPIAGLLGERLGVAVAIERIEGGWAGWRPSPN